MRKYQLNILKEVLLTSLLPPSCSVFITAAALGVSHRFNKTSTSPLSLIKLLSLQPPDLLRGFSVGADIKTLTDQRSGRTSGHIWTHPSPKGPKRRGRLNHDQKPCANHIYTESYHTRLHSNPETTSRSDKYSRGAQRPE